MKRQWFSDKWEKAKDPNELLDVLISPCCGCVWRDNFDGTISLWNSRACVECDNGPRRPVRPFTSRQVNLFAAACLRWADDSGIFDFVSIFAPREKMATARIRLRQVGCNGDTDTISTDKTLAQCADLFRCVVGNPFEPWATQSAYMNDLETFERLVSTRLDGQRNARDRILSPEILTPQVIELAQVAHSSPPVRNCRRCRGSGELSCSKCSGEGCSVYGVAANGACTAGDKCPNCKGSGGVADSTLDGPRLSVTADALEEAGLWCELAEPCPRCSAYRLGNCPDCDGSGRDQRDSTSGDCPVCDGDGKFPLGHVPERDVASGRHEGGWTNCKTCNGGGNEAPSRPGFLVVRNAVLTHLRSPGPHARGCWALRLLGGELLGGES